MMSNIWQVSQLYQFGNIHHDMLHTETILAVVNRAPVATHPVNDEGSPDEPETLKLKLPATARRWERQLLSKLRHDWHVPETVLVILFALRLRTWLAIVAWVVGAPVAHKFSLGPPYILGSLIVVIFLNLGTRQVGEASAYSIFNNFQELPGQLNAHRLDDQMRRGQM